MAGRPQRHSVIVNNTGARNKYSTPASKSEAHSGSDNSVTMNNSDARKKYSKQTSNTGTSNESEKCGICKKRVGENDNGLQCDSCVIWYHCGCMKINANEYEAINKATNLVRWFCRTCDPKIMQAITKIKELEERLDSLEPKIETVIRDRLEDYMQEEQEKNKRKQNIVIFGLKEPDERNSPTEREELDKNKITELHAGVSEDLKIAPTDIEKVFRLGKKNPNQDKPRPLCVKFNSTTKKNGILSAAKNLKSANNQHKWKSEVFIAPDFTLKQRTLQKTTYDELKRRKAQENYTIIRKDSPLSKGGLLMYIHDKHQSMPCAELNDIFYDESLWCWIEKDETNILVGVIYRRDSAGERNNKTLITLIERATILARGHLVITGDFNLPDIDWKNYTTTANINSLPQTFIDTVLDNYLTQHITSFTRVRGQDRPSTLDLVITKNTNTVEELTIDHPLGLSDHAVIKFDYPVEFHFVNSTKQPHYNYYKCNYDNIRSFMNRDWETAMLNQNIYEAWHTFKQAYEECINTHVPTTADKGKQKSKTPWLNNTATKAIKKKKCAWSRFQERRTTESYRQYIKARDDTKRTIRKEKCSYEKKLVNDMKKNPRAFYKYANRKSNAKKPVSNLKRDDGTTTQTNKETAEELNKYFSSVFTEETDREEIIFNQSINLMFGEEPPDPFDLQAPHQATQHQELKDDHA
ncbi:hypothetical protein Pmani_037425 [Petrolisthes manimaculis]|uniref:PHD-type domain-containing protein n=2 Tax=Petrolisthes manimaculis TaxID=1843537 RepID=A0AAE1NGA5_9EUCA|nr:hypothetical protein Pmani_037425 [Petrolisthes manimaculis]